MQYCIVVLPSTLSVIDLKYSAIVVCAVATFAAVKEGHVFKTGTESCTGETRYELPENLNSFYEGKKTKDAHAVEAAVKKLYLNLNKKARYPTK